MNACAGHIAERFDRPFQLALKRALIGDLLIELGLAPRHLVEELEAGTLAARRSHRSDRHVRRIQLVGRHAQGLSVGARLMSNALRIQLPRQHLHVGGLQASGERLVIRRANQASEQRKHDYRGRRTGQKKSLLPCVAARPVLRGLADLALQRCHNGSVLELHLFDILIGAHDFVAHLHHELE